MIRIYGSLLCALTSQWAECIDPVTLAHSVFQLLYQRIQHSFCQMYVGSLVAADVTAGHAMAYTQSPGIIFSGLHRFHSVACFAHEQNPAHCNQNTAGVSCTADAYFLGVNPKRVFRVSALLDTPLDGVPTGDACIQEGCA